MKTVRVVSLARDTPTFLSNIIKICLRVSVMERTRMHLRMDGHHADPSPEPIGWGIKKKKAKEVTQKLGKSILFLYGTHCLDLIHIAIKFHQNILYVYLGIACIRIV